MIGREAGEFCNAGCQQAMRETCTCVLPPRHPGLHWCVGKDHVGHAWEDEHGG